MWKTEKLDTLLVTKFYISISWMILDLWYDPQPLDTTGCHPTKTGSTFCTVLLTIHVWCMVDTSNGSLFVLVGCVEGEVVWSKDVSGLG